MAETSVTIIIPTYRRPAALDSTLRALRGLYYPQDRLEVIIVDDDGEAGRDVHEVVRRHYPSEDEARIMLQTHLGAASARNAGARRASGEVLIFLDDDIIVRPDHIRRHLETHARYGDCLVNGHWEFAPELKTALLGSSFGRFRLEVEERVKADVAMVALGDGCYEASTITACNMSASRNTFWRLGGFDEDFPMAGSEDYDIGRRALSAKTRLIFNANIHLLHSDERTTIEQYGDRQRQHGHTAVVLAAKYPERRAMRIIYENSPIARGEQWQLASKKLCKLILSRSVILSAIIKMLSLAATLTHDSDRMSILYRKTMGLYLFLGVREGIHQGWLEPTTRRG